LASAGAKVGAAASTMLATSCIMGIVKIATALHISKKTTNQERITT
jgi:hypothetical protein